MDKANAAQAVRMMKHMDGWILVEQYIRDRATDSRQRLTECKTWDEVLQHRGEAAAFEAVLSFVDQTIREAGDEYEN